MLFNSLIFLLVFLPLFLLGWYKIKLVKGKLVLLTGFSFIFYGYWDFRFVGLMLFSILVDFYCGQQISKHLNKSKKRARNWMIVSVVINLGILGFFKYFNFFIDTFYTAFPIEDIINRPALTIILPLGISFYTFQSMSYSVDLYRKQAEPVDSILHFSAYVSMFPQLIAGPIVRYRDMHKQLKNISNKIDYGLIYTGLFFFIFGLSKKLFVADYFAKWADLFFNGSMDKLFFVSWSGVVSYAFQIFFDFSAYSDMAIGLGMMFGFRLPQNFNSPYKATSFSDFWRRWHMTLSQFLRDYLYIPLGGNRKGEVRTYYHLILTMLLGGLWHGASWLFVIWGAIHGFFLALERLIGANKLVNSYLYRAFVFVGVCVAWIFFRSNSLDFALHTLKSCLFINGIESFTTDTYPIGANISLPIFVRMAGGIKHIMALVVTLIALNILPNLHQISPPKKMWFAFLMAFMMFAVLFHVQKPSPFIYFQF
ncbi:MAG: MBOAT family protein [Flavobacteriales bacterium]|jgi:alginate O-acetyltransferase complex protein AlgI|nr:MBOAT family protein [Flavobacteriales bacterium]